jgi:hypothetical protein
MTVKEKKVIDRDSAETTVTFTDPDHLSMLSLQLLRDGYTYSYKLDLKNDPIGINHGVDYVGLDFIIVAYDTNSEAAYNSGQVKFIDGSTDLELNTNYPINLPKGGSKEITLLIAPDLETLHYEEGELSFGLEVVHPLDLSGHNAVFGLPPFGVTAFAEPKKDSGISRGLKPVVGYGEKLYFDLFTLSLVTEELYEEYFELEG